MRRQHLRSVIIGSCLMFGAVLVLMAQSGAPSRSPGAQLREWNGQTCTVHLRLESDPRSGRSNFSTFASHGITSIEQIPVSVRGTIASVNDDAISVRTDGAMVWIPRDRIHLIVNEGQ